MKALKPVLAGLHLIKRGRSPDTVAPIDVHHQRIQREMLAALRTLKLAAYTPANMLVSL